MYDPYILSCGTATLLRASRPIFIQLIFQTLNCSLSFLYHFLLCVMIFLKFILFSKVLTGFCRLVVSAYLTISYSIIWSVNRSSVLYQKQDRLLGIAQHKGILALYSWVQLWFFFWQCCSHVIAVFSKSCMPRLLLKISWKAESTTPLPSRLLSTWLVTLVRWLS